MKLQVFSIVVAVVFLSQATARGDQATEAQAKEVKSLQGEWQLEAIEINEEKKVADEIQKLIRLEFQGDEWITTKTNGDGTKIVDRAKFKLDSSKSPKHLDLLALDGPGKGTTIKCIYSLEKDEFKFGMPLSLDGKRPTKFATGKDGDAGQVIVWRRVK